MEATTLDGMTQARWNAMTDRERDELRDTSQLNPQLVGLEGWRVEVTYTGYKEAIPSRFIVGKSTGWRPVHLMIHNRRSRAGDPATAHYATIRKIEKVR